MTLASSSSHPASSVGSLPARALARGAAAVAFACGLVIPFNVILLSAAGQDLRLLDVLGMALAPVALWICLRRASLLLALLVLGLLFVLPGLVHAVILLDRYGEYRDLVFPVRFLLAMPLFVALIPLLESPRHRAWFAVGLLLGCALNIVPLVFETLGQHETMVALGLAPDDLALNPWDLILRPPGLHGHANATSAVVTLAIPAAVFMASRQRQWWFLPCAVAALLGCLYYTETRSAAGISLATATLALVLRCRSDKLFLLLLATVLAGLVAVGWSRGPLLPESFARLDTAADNLSERFATILASLRLMLEYPLGLGRTLGSAAIYELTGVRGATALGARGEFMSVPVHNSLVWLGVVLGLLPALFTVMALSVAATQAGRPGAAGLRGLLAFHLLGLCLFEDHFQNQTFLTLLILLMGGWLVNLFSGVEDRVLGQRRTAPATFVRTSSRTRLSHFAWEERA